MHGQRSAERDHALCSSIQTGLTIECPHEYCRMNMSMMLSNNLKWESSILWFFSVVISTKPNLRKDKDCVRVSSYLWMLVFVIYTSELLTTWILLSGIEWVMLLFKYSQAWNVFTRWLFSVDSFRTETVKPWDDTLIQSMINVKHCGFMEQIKKIWDKI